MPIDFMSDNFPFAHLPADNTIHVWQIELDKLLSLGVNLDRFLSVEEHNRAERFVFAKDALAFSALPRDVAAWTCMVPGKKPEGNHTQAALA